MPASYAGADPILNTATVTRVVTGAVGARARVVLSRNGNARSGHVVPGQVDRGDLTAGTEITTTARLLLDPAPVREPYFARLGALSHRTPRTQTK